MRLIDADAMWERNKDSIYDITDLKEMLDYEPTVDEKIKTIEVSVSNELHDLLCICPFVSPNTELYHKLHELGVTKGDRLVFNETIAIVAEIEYGDGTIWYKIIETESRGE